MADSKGVVATRLYRVWIMHDAAKKAGVDVVGSRNGTVVQSDIEKWMAAGYVLEYEGATMININDPSITRGSQRVAQYT